MDQLRARMVQAYDDHQYHVVYHQLHQFCGSTLSAFYLDILKDRLYTSPTRALERLAAQSVLYRLGTDLCRLMAPVLCFTAEEIWQEFEERNGRAKWDGSTVHATTFPEPLEVERDDALLERFDRLAGLREEVSRALEGARREKRIGTPLEARIRIAANDDDRRFLESFGEQLRFLLIVSGVEFGETGDGAVPSESVDDFSVEVLRAEGTKCARCWHYTTDVGSDPEFTEVCGRCASNVRAILAVGEPG
jgi:isoleucyl-tRNA synthetase